MKNIDIDPEIKQIFDFDLAQESYQSIFDRRERLLLLVDRNQSPSKLSDILRLALRSNALVLVEALVEEKGIIPDTDILHYALVNAEFSAESSKLDREYSMKILKYLMQKIHYIEVLLRGSQEELDLHARLEGFMQALTEPQCIHISNNIWNKDKLNIAFEYKSLEKGVIGAIKSCQGFLAVTNESTLTLYQVAKNRLIASAYFEKYSEIVKVKEDKKVLEELMSSFRDRGECTSIKLAILQLPGFYINRKEYPTFLLENMVFQWLNNAAAEQALLGCRDENGQVMLGEKAKNKKWCIDFYKASYDNKAESVANLVDVNYTDLKLISKEDYKKYIDTPLSYLIETQLVIAMGLKEQLSLEKPASAKMLQVDEREAAGAFQPGLTPSVSSFSQNKKSKLL
jgi:hypothetical protein